MYRGALIGLGEVALNGHLPAWKQRSDFQIVAGIDPEPERRRLFLQAAPAAFVCVSLDDCDALQLDFVDICAPPYTHFELAKKALEKNLHVLCEKPLVLAENELEILRQLSQKHSKTLVTVHNWSYAPLCRKVSELIREKAVGDVRHCVWYVLRDGPARAALPDNWRLDPKKSGGGILIDHGWHAFYLVLDWIGKKPTSVWAELENRQYEDLPVEDTAKIKIEFEENAASSPSVSCEIFLTWASRVRRNWGAIEGDSGFIQIENDFIRLTQRTSSSPESEAPHKFDPPLSAGSHHSDWFEFVVDEFLMELSDEKQRGKNLALARTCLQLIAQSKVSHQSGQKIRL